MGIRPQNLRILRAASGTGPLSPALRCGQSAPLRRTCRRKGSPPQGLCPWTPAGGQCPPAPHHSGPRIARAFVIGEDLSLPPGCMAAHSGCRAAPDLFVICEALFPPPGRIAARSAGVSGEGFLPRPGSGAAPRRGLCHRRSPLPSPGPHGTPWRGGVGGGLPPPTGARGSAPGCPRGSLFGFLGVAPCICGRFMLSCL